MRRPSSIKLKGWILMLDPRRSRSALIGFGALVIATACEAALQAPTNVAAVPVVGTNLVAVSWTDSNRNESSIAIERSSDGITFTQVATVPGGVTSYQNPVVACGARYYYRVRALGNGNAASAYSAVTSAVPSDTIAPTAPPTALATPMSCSQINLAWTAASDACGVKTYIIYRNGVSWRLVTAPTTATSDTGLAANTTYTYTVYAADAAGKTSAGTVASARTLICSTPTTSSTTTTTIATTTTTTATTTTTLVNAGPPPSGLTGSAPSCSQVNLAWNAPAASSCGLRAYNVYRNSAFLKQVTASPTSDTAVAASTLYSYQVSAVYNSCAESTRSNVASTNTPACTSPPGQGALRWEKRGGGTGWDTGKSIAFDSAGNSVIAGYFCGTASFGGASLTPAGPAGDCDVFVAKYSPTGAHLWSRRAGGTSYDSAEGVAFDRNGDVIVIGYYYGTADFGGGGLASAGDSDIFVAKYSGATGAPLWSRRFGGRYADSGVAVATDASNNVILTASFNDWVDFGGGILKATGGTSTVVEKLSPAGAYVWALNYTSSASNTVTALTVDSGGNAVVTGEFLGNMTCGPSSLTNPSTSALAAATFLARVSSAGATLWCKGIGTTTGGPWPRSVATDTSANVYLTGYFAGATNFGTGSLTSAGGYDIFVAKFSSAGAALSSRRIGGLADDQADGIVVDGAGGYEVVGTFAGTVDFGGGAQTTTSRDMFVARYSSTGGYVWAKHFPGAQTLFSNPAALDASGDVAVAGQFSGTVNFGGGAMTSAGNMDVYVTSFAP